jgi:hypothetical protein
MMQRVGRINRVDTKFDKIYTFNFFPTTQSNDQIKLKEAAEYKIQAFIEMLGADARLLTDGEEIKSHDLFNRLISKKTITGEDGAEESELKYLQVIRDIRDNDPILFDHIKRLPKKVRTGRRDEYHGNSLLTYFRKGKLQKFYFTKKNTPEEIDFMAAAQILDTPVDTVRENIPANYFDLLNKNKQAFKEATTEVDLPEPGLKGGRDSASFVLKVLKSKQVKHCLAYTEDDEVYVQELTCLLEEGALPKQTTKTLVKALGGQTDPLKILGILKTNVPSAFFKDTVAESSAQTNGPREVILSEYLVGKNG